jgi:hypothetical protein
MRKLFAALGVLALVAGPAAAQGTYNCPDALEGVTQDDGGGGFAFKTGNPSGPSDWFSVDFNNELASLKIVAICVKLLDAGNPNKSPAIGKMGIYPDNLFLDPTGATPDIGNPIVERAIMAAADAEGCGDVLYFTINPPIHLTSAQGVHVSYNHKPGDSVLFVCSDGTGPASGRSSLSTNGYATPGPVLGVDWNFGVGVVPQVQSITNRFLINGSLAAVAGQLEQVALSFYGPDGSDTHPGSLYMVVLQPPFGTAKVLGPLPTWFGGPISTASTVCGLIDCQVPAVPIPIPLRAIYLDVIDTKPNGKAKLKQSNVASLLITANPTACGKCYGQKDDGAVGLGAWTTAIPTGSGDWFNVRHGTPSLASGVMTLTGVQIATVVSFGTCGGIVGNPAGGWDAVGIFPEDLAQDSSGGTPDQGNPAAAVAPLPIANGTLQWGYPAAFANTPDIAGGPSYHAAVKWDTADSCMRVTADDSTAAGPDACGTIPSSTSFSTVDGYATNALAFSQVNWLLKIDWK